MGSLPVDRVTIARPFLKVGIDFGGPFMIKQSRLRNSTTSKAYICIFICMVTKAIHIEVVSSLSTEAFLDEAVLQPYITITPPIFRALIIF